MPMALKRGWRDALAILSLAALVIIFFWRLALTNLALARGDALLYFYPQWDYRAAALRAGHVPLWDPYLFMGVPFLANSQAGVLYPPNWPLAWLPSPVAFKMAAIAHIILAGAGAFVFARHALRLTRTAAGLAGVIFGLGGYLTAQVEHINQLQGLAWLPLAFVFVDAATSSSGRSGEPTGTQGNPRRIQWRWVAGLAVILALQFLAGHTQSVFITFVGLVIYAGWPLMAEVIQRTRDRKRQGEARVRSQLRYLMVPLITVSIAAVGALALAAAQLIPTLELSQLSQRGGGLPVNEALSFSLNPLLLGRALLPGYGQTIFTEYVGYLGASSLLLALIGAWTRRSQRRVASMAGLAILGLLLALGGYDPLYWLLVRFVPGFNLFRAPARWLALYAFAGAMLAGVGLDTLQRHVGSTLAHRELTNEAETRRPLVIGLLTIGLLGISTAFGERPSLASLGGWLLATALSVGLINIANRPMRSAGLVAVVVLELFGASRALPYNHPTAPEAVTELRPAVAQLLLAAQSGPLPPARFLSMSDILFDPGDLGEIHSIYDSQLPPDAVYDYIVATKAKEVLAPNLPLSYRIMAADGFDGGLLPLHRYVELEPLLLPPERISPDGRLRENVRGVPGNRILDLLNIGILITDKTGDVWIDGVYYDLQQPVALSSVGASLNLNDLPPFEATTLGVVARLMGGPLPDGTPVAQVVVRFADGHEASFDLPAGEEVVRLRWKTGPARVQAIRVEALNSSAPFLLRGLTLIDERSGAFQPLTVSDGGHWRLVHSGDVKVYMNPDVLPRAFVAHQARVVSDDTAALAALRSPDFQPATTVILSSGNNLTGVGGGSDRLTVLNYRPEHVSIEAELDSPGILVLSDADYPGWHAQVDGRDVPILRANLLFRAVALSAGYHRVEFVFDPLSWRLGLALTSASVLALLATGSIWLAKQRVRLAKTQADQG